MKKNTIYLIVLIIGVCVMNAACKKDSYITGGSLNQAKVNMTTYDYLKGNSAHLFDTLILLIDAAGLKDSINQSGITFFAPTDYSIDNYMLKKQFFEGYSQYNLDSMLKYDLNTFKDSIGLYFVRNTLNYNMLTAAGTSILTGLDTVHAIVSYEPTTNPALGYYDAITTPPSIVYYTVLGEHTRCQTFGVQTTTGVLGALGNEHILFFN